MCRRVLDWYHFYINHPGGSRLAKIIREVCYCKDLVMQTDMFDKMCNIYQQFKKRKTISGHLTPKNIAELKPWETLHVYLIGPYIKSIIQQHTGGTIIQNNYSLTFMKVIDPATGWFDIVEIPMFAIKEVALVNDDYIDKSSDRGS